jgi:hypothetical protein
MTENSIAHNGSGALLGSLVSQNIGGPVIAEVIPGTSDVIVGGAFDSLPPSLQGIILVHEDLHVLTGLPDSTVAAMLGYGGRNPSGWITNFISNGCPPTKRNR